jgi:hypothetical protein
VLKNLTWKINRLRTMSAPEIGYRVSKAIQIKAESLGLGLARQVPAPDMRRTGQPWLAVFPSQLEAGPYRAAAERVLAGHLRVFALDAQLGFPPRWNRDPKTGKDSPLVFGKSLNYRNEDLVGDIKYLWEPSRHLQLVTLAQAYHLSGDQRYANGVQELLESWFDQCPYPMGVHWTSSLELAIRLVNWSFAWHLLGGDNSALFASEDGKRFKRRWLDSVYQHSHFIAAYMSRHSSANNHLFGELMGLFVAATTWPCWNESARWQKIAHDELEIEAIKQNTRDGVNREQAVYYQHEVIDMMLICWLVGRANGISFSEDYFVQLERLLEFIASVMDVSGNVPMMGDADDALIVHWSKEPQWNPYRSLLASGAALFKRADFKEKAGAFDDKSSWLLGDAAGRDFDAVTAGSETVSSPCAFPEGGYFIMGSELDKAGEIRLVIDAAPLGYLSIAAHGHADALAFTLSAAGCPLLIDPGTYSYHTQKIWRDYFKGTSAHNTVRVDGIDQSESGGNFMWLRKANASCEHWSSEDDRDIFIGSHDGYAVLPDPVIHRRKIEFIKDEGTIIVEDILECKGQHEIELHWHFSEECQVAPDVARVLISRENVRLEMMMPNIDWEPEVYRGRLDPPLGWIAYRFDEKMPSPTIVWREKIIGTTARVTIFRLFIL